VFNEYWSNSHFGGHNNNDHLHHSQILAALQKIKAKNLIQVKNMPYTRFKKLNIHYRDEGIGSALIFLQGLSDSADFWKLIDK